MGGPSEDESAIRASTQQRARLCWGDGHGGPGRVSEGQGEAAGRLARGWRVKAQSPESLCSTVVTEERCGLSG